MARGGKELSLEGLALCWVCGDPVPAEKCKMSCDLCQGWITTVNAIHGPKSTSNEKSAVKP